MRLPELGSVGRASITGEPGLAGAGDCRHDSARSIHPTDHVRVPLNDEEIPIAIEPDLVGR
jgi:hypothetical protein